MNSWRKRLVTVTCLNQPLSTTQQYYNKFEIVMANLLIWFQEIQLIKTHTNI